MVKTERRSTGRFVGELIFIILAAIAILLWLGLLIAVGFFQTNPLDWL